MMSTEGQNQLAIWLSRPGQSAAKLARLLNVNARTVARWKTGESSPSLRCAAKLKKETGISTESWNKTPTDEETRNA